MAKKIDITLTPQNEEWIKLIPNQSQNLNIIFNKLIDNAINDGLLIETIASSLTISDLKKFEKSYQKLEEVRSSFLESLNVQKSEKSNTTQIRENENENEIVAEKKSNTIKKSSGFSEESF